MFDKKIKPIMISGPYCCAKGILASLLDSSSILALPQWHDMLIDIFYRFINIFNCNKQIISWRDKDDRVILLRKLLSEHDYPMIEQYALRKKIVFPFAANQFKELDFNFDYYNQTKEFFEQFYNMDTEDINLENLSNLFLQTFVNNLDNANFFDYKYFVSASEPGFNNFENIINMWPEIKIIYINRPDWIFSQAARLEMMKHDTLHVIFNDRRLPGIIQAENNYRNLAMQYPDNFKIIEFKDLIENTHPIMVDVINFIGADWNDIYDIPTYFTKEIPQQITGKIIDTPETLGLSPALMQKLEKEYLKRKGKAQKSITLPALTNFLHIKENNTIISSNDISVVVQSNTYDKQETEKCLKSVRKYLPDAEVILSTWEGCDVDHLDYDVLVTGKDPGGVDMLPIINETNNVNRHIISTINGLKKANRKYILKLRADLTLNGSGFLSCFNNPIVQNLKREKEYSIFNNRIITDSCFTRNSEYNSCTQIGLCFHPSDLWFFGEKDDLETLFDIPLQEKFIAEVNGQKFQYRTPEQYTWTSCLEKHNWHIYMDTCLYNTPYTCEISLKSIVNNFFILNHNKTGIQFPKTFKKYPKRAFKYVLSTKRYLELYQSYYDPSYKLPKEFKYYKLSDVYPIQKYINEMKASLQPVKNWWKKFREFVSPISFLWKVPCCLIKILFKIIFNSYKLIWWMK